MLIICLQSFAFIIAGALLFFLLIKERKQSKLLKEKNDNYENIYQQANDAMLVVDVANGRILQTNQRAAQILGYTPEKLSKLTVFNLHPAELLAQCAERIADAWEQGGAIYQDIPFIAASGAQLPVECSVTVAAISKRPAVLIYARDISERVKMEKEIAEQRKIIDQKNKDITDSIQYARRIQQSIFPVKTELQQLIPESFILFKPKDIVSGDFYWFSKAFCNEEKKDVVLIAAADCTGHGVPGAFMSVLGVESLFNNVVEKGITQPAIVLNNLHERVRLGLKQSAQYAANRDGMDIALCRIDIEKKELQFAGAFRPLYFVNANGSNFSVNEIKADKYSIGGFQGEEMRRFTNKTLSITKGDTIYLCSDGYADQFGGSEGKKLMTKCFKELLMKLQPLSLQAQKEQLDAFFNEWKGNHEQVDDVLVIGLRF